MSKRLYTEVEVNKIKDESWKEGYQLGIKVTLKENDKALRIGKVIIDTLDERYEFQKEDY